MTAPKVETYRYAEPNTNGLEGWFVAFLDSIGCLAVLSDYGGTEKCLLTVHELDSALREAHARGRLAGLREAAEVAEADLLGGPKFAPAEIRFDGGASERTARRIAAAIRALAAPDAEEQP